MTERWKKDDPQHLQPSFFSHKAADGSWCNGKAKTAQKTDSSLQFDLILAELFRIKGELAIIKNHLGITELKPSNPEGKKLPF